MLQFLKRTLFAAFPHSIPKRGLSIGTQLRDKILEQMFNEAYQKYKDKSSGGGFFEPSEKILNELDSAQKVLLQKYNAKDEAEISAFPKFDFADPEIDPLMEEPECEECNECDEPQETGGEKQEEQT